MWDNYRRFWIPTQAMILTIAILATAFSGAPYFTAIFYIAIMEAFAILGVFWSWRLRGKFDRARDKKQLSLRR